MTMQQKRGSTLISAILAAVLLTLLLPVSGLAAVQATVNTGPIDVYTTAHLGSPAFAQLAQGTRVDVISYDANWAEITVGAETGYVVTSYLTFDSAPTHTIQPMPMPTVDPIPQPITTATVRSGPLNVHSAATLRAPVIAQLTVGSRVSIASYDSNWAEVILRDGTGWVVTSYLSFGSAPQPTLAPSPTSTPATHEKANTPGANATVATDNHGPLHLRVSPDANATILNTYANGSRIVVHSQKGEWYYVTVGSRVGYMLASYVRLDSGVVPGGNTNDTQTWYDAIVNNPTDGEILHLRAKPSTDSEILGSYHNGTYVAVLGVGTEWLQVVVDDVEGYMMAKYVHITSPDATPYRVVAGEDIPLYDTPAVSGNIVLTLAEGQTIVVEIPGVEPGWSKISYSDGNMTLHGYAEDAYLAEGAETYFELETPGNG